MSGASGYIKRAIDVIIQLGKGNYGESGFDTVTLSGLAVSVNITKSGMPGFNSAELRIFGMRLDLMNQISTLGLQAQSYTRNNIVSINAGDAVSGMPLVFTGTILEAWADFQGSPDVSFNMTASTGAIGKIKPVPAASFNGPVDVATVMQSLATQMGFGFENNGVSVILPYQYYPGTAMDQAEACARAADIHFLVDNHTLAIWPKNGNRGGLIPAIGPATGMIGYPSYTGTGIRLRTLYNPSIIFGGQIKVSSIVTPAQGIWVVNMLAHALESETVGGAWDTEIGGYRLGSQPTLSG